MRALWGKAPFQFDLREVPTPTPNVGEVLVRVTGCGICGTDLHFLRAMNHEWTPLGHELAGCVEEVGAGVSRLRFGDSVVIENNSGCSVCDACKNGESRYCRNIWTYMNDQAGIGDYVCVPETSLQKHHDLSPRQATVAEPLTVAIDVTLRADIPHAMARWKVHVKDLPGSPITDQGLFPMNGIVWELNYRGELGFMYQARAQSETRMVRVEDGWVYFLHGWTQGIAQVYHQEIRGERFDRLAAIAGEIAQ